MNEHDLITLKADIEDAKSKLSEMKGSRRAMMSILKEKYDCTTLEDAENLHETLTKEIEALDSDIAKGLSDIEIKYPKLNE